MLERLLLVLPEHHPQLTRVDRSAAFDALKTLPGQTVSAVLKSWSNSWTTSPATTTTKP